MIRWNEYFSSSSIDMIQTEKVSEAMSRVDCKSTEFTLDIDVLNAIFADQVRKGFDNKDHL